MFDLRAPLTAGSLAWAIWFVIGLALTWQPFLWHIDYFHSPGPVFHTLILVALPLLGGFIFLYQFVRRRGLWRYEPLVLAALGLATCFFYQPRATATVLFFGLACYAVGRWCRERLGLAVAGPDEEISLSTGIGVGAGICVLFVVGLLGGYDPWFLALLQGLPVVVFRRQLRRLFGELGGLYRGWTASVEMSSPWMAVVVTFAAIFLSFTLLVTLAPSLAHDALQWHIPAAKYYAEVQALAPVPHMDYSYYPQAVETVMAAAHSLGGQPAAQMINPLFFALTLLLACAVARQCGIERTAATTGLVFAASIPFLHWTGSVAKNDLALAYFQLAALHSYLRARKSDNTNWLRIGAFFLALSFGVKYTAVFGAIPLGILYLHLIWKRPHPRRLLANFAVVFLLFGTMWQGRAFWLTGNPIYPQEIDDLATARRPIARAQTRSPLPGLYLRYPWIVHFQGRGNFESPSSNPVGVFLILFWPMWLLLRRRKASPEERACLFFVLLYLLYLGYVWVVLRYAIVPFLLLFLFTAARLVSFHDRCKPWTRVVLRIASAYAFAFAMLVTMIIEVNAPQLRLFAGQLEASGYLREALVPYRALEYLRRHSQPDEVILAIGTCARAYAPSLQRFHCLHINPRRFSENAERDIQRVRTELDGGGYSILLTPRTLLGESVVQAVRRLWAVKLAYRDEHFAVYRLAPKDSRTLSGF